MAANCAANSVNFQWGSFVERLFTPNAERPPWALILAKVILDLGGYAPRTVAVPLQGTRDLGALLVNYGLGA